MARWILVGILLFSFVSQVWGQGWWWGFDDHYRRGGESTVYTVTDNGGENFVVTDNGGENYEVR